MRVLTLRARVPGARPIELHRRITVLAHVSPGDRDALRSTFAALTEPAVPGLEAVLQIQDTTVPLDDAFARTYGLLEAPSAVVDVPAAASGAQGVEPPAAFANTASSASLRVKRDNLRSELTSTRRAIEEEKLYRVGRDSRSEGAVHRGLRSPSSVRQLADQLAAALGGPEDIDPLELADQLDELAVRRRSTGARDAALAQLMSECRVAIDSVKDALSLGPGAPPDAATVARIEAVRDEMIQLAGGEMNRRARKRLGELRALEAELLASLGYASHPELSAALAAQGGNGSDEMERAAARLELLHELEAFWGQRREQVAADRVEEGELLERAAELLGEPSTAMRSPRLAAVKLRTSVSPASAGRSRARVLAGRLAGELGYEPGAGLTPREVLQLAEAELDATDALGGGDGEGITAPVERAEWRSSSSLAELEAEERRLESQLSEVEGRLAALERATLLGGAAEGASAPRAAEWSLAAVLGAQVPQPHVGSVPVLLVEPESGPTALDSVDVPTIVAMAAKKQIVWVTDRPEVIEGMELLGSLGTTIIV